MLVAVALAPRPAGATVEMQNQAKKLGFAVKNCLDCHASPHAADVMKKTAKGLGISEGNCLACHGANIPAALNQKGEWLVSEKKKRGAKQWDMGWLKDYEEPTPAQAPTAPKAPAAKAGKKPEAVQLAPRP